MAALAGLNGKGQEVDGDASYTIEIVKYDPEHRKSKSTVDAALKVRARAPTFKA